MIYDISPVLNESLAVWPGDTPLTRVWQARIADGSNLDLSTIQTTVHIGAHADAPSHYSSSGLSIDQVALEAYWGPCILLTVKTRPLILPEDVVPVLGVSAKRVLFRTESFEPGEVFARDFVAFSPSALEVLGKQGVVLVGIDTPSVDPFDSKALPAHQTLLKFRMANLEGLNFTKVPDGRYELVALPLKLQGFDASPVRAALRTL